jgi:putative oxidoreductase
MKIVSLIARYLLGLVFLVFGLNGFFHFLPMQMPQGVALQFAGAMAASHYMDFVFAVQLVGGILLLVNRFVPLALVFLGPVIVNILLFHSTMLPAGLPLALITAILWFLVFYSVRGAFAGIFLSKVPAQN